MTEKRFSIMCTGRGSHGRIDWPALILAEDGTIRQEATRRAASPVRGTVDGTVDGEQVSGKLHHKAVVATENHRSEYGTWRWKCPRCGIDKPLSGQHLLTWMNLTSAGVLDVSHLPR